MVDLEIRTLIEALEGYRALIGDAALDAVVQPLRSQLGDDGLPRAERRIVTMMFADLVGFTELATHADPEDVRDLINACFTHLLPVIDRFGGTVDKFIGDAMMVLFGAPLTHENDPERAVRAGLALFTALDAFNARHGTQLAMHIGINTGLVVAGGLGAAGRQQYTVLGDAVNLASRLMNHAGSGEIILGEDTYRAVAPLVEAVALPPVQVKGKDAPVTVYRLVGLAALPGSTRGIAGLRAPLVGRDAELTRLKQLLDHLQDGEGSIALLVGEAGLGKSRLLRELEATARQQGVTWLDCQGVAHDSSRAYSQFSQLLRRSFGISDTDSAATIRSKLHDQLQGRADLSPIAQAVLEMVLTAHTSSDARLTGALFGRQLRSVVRTWWREQAAHSPLVLVFDDLHWSDTASSTLMQELFDLTREVPVLFICSTRPDWAELPLPLARRFSERFNEMILQPLDSGASNELVNHLLQVAELPAELRQRMLEQSEGNPFFVEEVVRELIASGALVASADGSQWHASPAAGPINLPENLHGLLMARIDRLETPTRQMLQWAAVIGRTFNPAVLHRLAPNNGVIEQLEQLEQAALIRPVGHDFAFRHALTHEATYRSILVQERRQLHRQVGEALEQIHPERGPELAPLLARHFAIANDAPRALRYYRQAGDSAAAVYAHAEATTHYAAALELDEQHRCATSAERRHLFGRLGRVYEISSRNPEAADLYERMITRAADLEDAALLMDGLLHSATLLAIPSEMHNPAQARNLATQGQTIARRLSDASGEARALWVLMLSYDYGIDTPQAYACGQKALTIARAHGLREQEAYLLNDISRSAMALRGLQSGIEYTEAAHTLWRELDNLPMLADNLSTLAMLLYVRGELAESYARASEAIQLSQRIGNDVGSAMSVHWRATVDLEWGNVQPALDQLQHIVTTNTIPFMITLNGADLAWAYAQLGAYDRVRQVLDSTGDGIEAMAPIFRSWPEAVRARASLRMGDTAAAIALIRRYSLSDVTTAASFGIFLLPIVHIELALLRGDYERGLEVVESLATVGQMYQARLFTCEVLLYQGVLLTRMGQHQDAWEVLEDAVAAMELNNQLRLEPALLLTRSVVASALDNPQLAEELLHAGRNASQRMATSLDDPQLRDAYEHTPLYMALHSGAAVLPWLPY